MLLMIDNYDSFVYNLVRYFEELGEEIKVVRNDKITIKEIKEMNREAGFWVIVYYVMKRFSIKNP